MQSLLFLILHLVIAAGTGALILRWLDRRSRLSLWESLILSPLIGYAVYYYAVFGIGIFKLDTLSMSILMVALLPFAVLGLRFVRCAELLARTRGLAIEARSDVWLALLVCLFVAICVTSLLQGMAPPNDYDSLMYHITGPKFDIESGRLATPWDRALPHFLFPAMMGNQSRLALALSDPGGAQMTHGMLGIFAGALTALLMRRLEYGRSVSMLAAVLFVSTRVVVWEMGTVEVEVPLAAFMIAAVLVYAHFRQTFDLRLGVLFGVTVGCMILTKFHGLALALAFGPVILFDMWTNRRSVVAQLVGPLTAAVMFVPQALRVYPLTGNPIFPLFNQVFDSSRPDLFEDTYHAYGTGTGIVDLVTTPWLMSVEPMKYFDGMIYGFPIFVALAPLTLLEGRNAKRWLWLISILFSYYVIWLLALGQQVRFLLPIMPLFAGLSAAGAAAFWRQSANLKSARYAFAVLTCFMFFGQSMFVGIYSALRLPVALGFMTPSNYHKNTPTLGGAHFETCGYIGAHLKPGERYFALVAPLSFYCPQVPAIMAYFPDEAKWWLASKIAPALTYEEFVRHFKESNFRFVFLPRAWVNRRNASAEEFFIQIDPNAIRFGNYLYPAVASLEPLATDSLSAIYDGAEVLRELAKMAPKP